MESGMSRGSLLLVAEIGNTTASFAVFSGETCLDVFKVPSAGLSGAGAVEGLLVRLSGKYPGIEDIAFCSVVPDLDKPVLEALGKIPGGRTLQVGAGLALPFTLRYDNPGTFGADRIALCACACMRYPGEAVIALDIGTAITIDVIASSGDYLGGIILPGLDLMARVLHEHTARLPLVKITEPGSLTGFSTEECIRNGIVWNCVAGIEGVVSRLEKSLADEFHEEHVTVLATGGNASLLSSMFGFSSDLDELAVLRGTRYLFEINFP